jgi:hypothetical protein
VQARQSRCAGNATETEDRHPSHIGSQSEPHRNPGIQRRHRQTGHRGRHNKIDVGGVQAGLVESGRDGLATKVHRPLDVDVVRVAEVVQRGEPIERHDDVAGVDLRALVQGADDLLVLPEAGESRDGIGEFILRVAMGW